MSKILLSYLFKTNLSAFRAAILANDTNRICRILDIERNYITKPLDGAGNTALLLAIKYATPLTVQLLLKQGAQPDQPNFVTHQTPLSLLASNIYHEDQVHDAKLALEMATILLDHDAYVDKPSSYKYTDENGKEIVIKETPLMTAVRTKNLSLATLFVDRKANINYMEQETENRPIHYTIIHGDEEMFDLLENAGASIRTVVTYGDNTLLHWFCSNVANDQHRSLLKKLIEAGCDVNAENNLQRTPLMSAAKLNMINTCEILLNCYADTEKIDYRHHRAIDLAKIGSECFKVLQYATNVRPRSQSNQNLERIIYKKPLAPHRQLSLRISEPSNTPNLVGYKIKRYPSNTNNTEKDVGNEKNFQSTQSLQEQENDSRYKRNWGRLLQRKQKIRQTKHSSTQTINDLS
ncbi:unnamed protein product [Adineta steineri]|uniref:Ankyrin repeat protein n=1 Tax=Adineta steineri TaxID=433720 RepID=A0A814Y5Y8_9BILA|nr:unnamed protein product [Adineta steineri]CAF1224578.1 unnamed protein product [Adineta steineri]